MLIGTRMCSNQWPWVMLTTPNHSIFDILYRLSYSAVTIFSNDIEIATLDQNRKKIEWSILPSQSYNFHESKKSSFNDGCQQITLHIMSRRRCTHRTGSGRQSGSDLKIEISKYVTPVMLNYARDAGDGRWRLTIVSRLAGRPTAAIWRHVTGGNYVIARTCCLDQHLITISSPTVLQSVIVSAAVWPPLPRPPSLSLSVRLLHAPAERGKTPAWSPVLSTQISGPQVAVVIARRRGLMRHAGLWPTHSWPTSWGTLPMSWLGIKLLHHRRLSPMLLSPRVEFSGPCRSHLAALLPIFSSRICIRGRSYVQGNNRRVCN